MSLSLAFNMRPNVDQALLKLEGVDPPLMRSKSSTAYGQSDVVTYSTYQGKTGNGHGRLVRISFIYSVFVMYTMR